MSLHAQGGWPRNSSEINAEWFSEVFSVQAEKPLRVSSMTKQRVGTGQVGECWRVGLKFTEEGHGAASAREIPSSVIVKMAASDPASRAAGASQSCYLKEVGFYRDLQARVQVRTPRCFFVAIAANEVDHVLVLEDMSPAQQGDQLKGCRPHLAFLALQQLALFQGPLWGNRDLLEMDWLGASSQESREELIALFCALHGEFLHRFKGRVGPEVEQVVRWLADNIAGLMDEEDPMCLTHGDFRSDNLLFGDGSLAPEVTVVDWQTLRLGPGPRDAAYFLGGSLSVRDRRQHERSLVEAAYYKTLQASGVDELSFDDCWLQYRRGAFAGVLMVVMASMMVGETDRGDEMFLTMARRHSQHVIDVDAMGAVSV